MYFKPLLGQWQTRAESDLGPVRCTRIFEAVMGGSYVQLRARWEYGDPSSGPTRKPYEEIALIGAGDDGTVTFWSFTSDGKRSVGRLADVSDCHPEAIGFEAQMPAGLARMVYWPAEDDGFIWVVEARNAKGWSRFLEHHYRPLGKRATSAKNSIARAACCSGEASEPNRRDADLSISRKLTPRRRLKRI